MQRFLSMEGGSQRFTEVRIELQRLSLSNASRELTESFRRLLKTSSRGPSLCELQERQHERRLCRAVTEDTTMTSLLSSRDLVAECRIRSMSSFICTTFQHERGYKRARTVRVPGAFNGKTRHTLGIRKDILLQAN